MDPAYLEDRPYMIERLKNKYTSRTHRKACVAFLVVDNVELDDSIIELICDKTDDWYVRRFAVNLLKVSDCIISRQTLHRFKEMMDPAIPKSLYCSFHELLLKHGLYTEPYAKLFTTKV